MPAGKSEIDDIFNIPTDGSHLDDAGSHDNAGYSTSKKKKAIGKFEDEALRASEMLSGVTVRPAPSVEKPVDIPAVKDNLVNDLSAPMAEKHIVSKKKNEVTEHPHEEEAVDQSVTDWTEMPIDGEWRVSHPDPRFVPFYEAKKRALSSWLLPGGRLKFAELNKELRNSRMDMSDVVIGDIRNLFEKMRCVQTFKDRVSYIISCCNEQYYPWKRAVDMFTGVLARIQYLKPAQRQGGLNAEHMADMERYLSELEALHFNAEHVSRNLDSVYEMLSRQVTMSMPQSRDVEVMEKRASKATASDASASASVSFLDQMDSVPQSSTPSRAILASLNKAKTGTVDWE
jgi:hypothetical protein